MNLDELKKKLLAALPPALREKLGIELDEDNENEEDIDGEEATANHDIDEISSNDDGDEEEGDAEDDEDDEEAAKKAKKSKLIRMVVILAVAFFALDEFMTEPTEDVVPEVTAPQMSPFKKAMLEKKKKEEEARRAAEAAGENESPSLEDFPEDSPVAENVESQQPQVAEPVEVVTEQVPSPIEIPEPAFEEEQSSPEVVQIEVPPETPVEVLKPTEGKVAVVPPSQPPIDESASKSKESSLDMLMKAVDKSEEMTETSLKTSLGRTDPSYIEPPNYLRSGRGLVYNCKENHWACVDKFSYFTCFENQKWNQDNSQDTECITRDVYASEADCASIQKFYVNKPEPTDFCGKKQENLQAGDKSYPESEQDISNIIAP